MQYELPPHPEHTMQWSPREQRVIVNHVNQAIEPLQKRIAELEAQITQLTASLETASAACIVLKQKQREGWAQIASGQEPVGEREAFEAWMRLINPGVDLSRRVDGSYWSDVPDNFWAAWQARAAHNIKG
jgi:hypothetical protein